MGPFGKDIRLVRIMDHKKIVTLKRLKRRYISFNNFKKQMLLKNILVGEDDTFYFIRGNCRLDHKEFFLKNSPI